jgi:IclR family KDG regulon transcriptional repressor
MPEISKTADQTLLVLEAVALRGPVTATELARSLKLARTIVNRSLATLKRRGYVRRVAAGYLPGVALLNIAERVSPDLLVPARPLLAKLAAEFGETFMLNVPDGGDAVQIAQVVGDKHFVRVELTRGFRHPLVQGASGRAILAYLDDPLQEKLVAATQRPAELRRELAKVRKLGVATSHDELSAGVWGMSVPVRSAGEVLASIGVVVPIARSGELPRFLPAMKRAAQALARPAAQG